MGSFCSKTSKYIPQVIHKNSNTPKIPQPKALKLPDDSKLDTNSTSLSAPTNRSLGPLSNQPRKGVIAEIAQNAAGVAIGTAIGRKIANMFDDKKGVETTVESSNEKDYSVDNQLKNEELTEEDSSGQGDEENDDDSDQ